MCVFSWRGTVKRVAMQVHLATGVFGLGFRPPPRYFLIYLTVFSKVTSLYIYYVPCSSFFKTLFNIYTSPVLVDGLVTCSLLPKKVLYFLACYAMIIYMCVLKKPFIFGICLIYWNKNTSKFDILWEKYVIIGSQENNGVFLGGGGG